MDTLNNGMLGVTFHGPAIEINPSSNPLTVTPPQPIIVLQQAINTLENLNDSKLNLQRSETLIILELHGCMDKGQRADLLRQAEHIKAELEALEIQMAPIATTTKCVKKAMSHGKPKSIEIIRKENKDDKDEFLVMPKHPTFFEQGIMHGHF